MTSMRYITLVIIYLAGHYFSVQALDAENPKLIHNKTFILGLSTFIFFLILKYKENNCNDNTKRLPVSYIYSQSIFYTILALLSQYIYKFFLNNDCMEIVSTTINDINDFTHIPEALFTAGIVLLTNNLSLYLIYPKCN
jgi:hypothetical protein